MRSKCCLLCLGSAILLCSPAVAQQVVIDFESPTYTPGTLDGQDGWTETQSEGGVAEVIDTDNGPSAGGSQCLELNDLLGYASGRIRVDRAFADVIASGGRLVTFKYDVRRVTHTDVHWAEFRVPGTTCAHWWDNWSQWSGYLDISYSNDGWDSWHWPSYDDLWHTMEWTLLYGDSANGECGLLLTASFDGVEIEETHWGHRYMGAGYPEVVDGIYLLLDEAYFDAGYDDVLYVDNILIRGDPTPSAVPVADAGPDVTQDPGSWDGVLLDGSGSSDDGEIVRYRWSLAGAQLYAGAEATATVYLPEGVHEIMLEVIDDDGLRNADMVTYTIGELPPILDQVAGPWGIRNCDIYGTNASTEIPIDTRTGEIEVVNIVHHDGPWSGLPGEHNGHVVFDRAGNLYYNCWNEYLESYTPDLQRRWRGHDQGNEVRMGDGGEVGNGTAIAGIRYIYAVGGAYTNDPNVPYGEPAAYAFDKATGQLAWRTGLTGENWSDHQGRPKLTLYNDKLYVVGENVEMLAKIHQLDATTGNLDWSSSCYVEMQWNLENNPGSVAFVPDAYGVGLHGMFFNQKSEPGSPSVDGWADMVAIEIDPDPATGGATVVWGPAENIDGPGLNNSHPIYSPTTGRVYTPSMKDSAWPYSMYGWHVPSGSPPDYQLYGTHAPDGDVGHGYRDNFVLDFDGVTVHAPGEFDTIRSYTDNGNGTFSMGYRYFGGWTVHGWGFREQGALLRDQNGDSIFLTGTEGYADVSDPNVPILVPPQVVALNLSEPVGDPNQPCTPIASIVVSEWDEVNEEWIYSFPQYGPTPGPDGSFYIFQNRGWNDCRIVRLRFVEPECVGDIDGDGDTDLADLSTLLTAYGTSVGDPLYNPAADFDGDGTIGLADLSFLLTDYGCTP